MVDFGASDWLEVATLASIMAGIVAVTLVSYRSSHRERYNVELQRVQLEKLRESLESRIYELNARLLSTEDRWRDVNHLLVSSVTKTPEVDSVPAKTALTGFLKAAGLREQDLRIDPHLVFVLTPFHQEHDEVFDAIVGVCRNAGLKCLRGDEELVKGDLLAHILRLIVSARLVVVNIEGRNANVFYELGIAHALDKTTIIVSRGLEDVPFDVRSRKLILYEDVRQLSHQLGQELTRALVAESPDHAG